MPVDRLPLAQAMLQPTDVRLGHARIDVEREDQRDIDVDALVDHLLDGGEALRVAGILIMTLGRSTRLAEAPRLGDGLRVVSLAAPGETSRLM